MHLFLKAGESEKNMIMLYNVLFIFFVDLAMFSGMFALDFKICIASVLFFNRTANINKLPN